LFRHFAWFAPAILSLSGWLRGNTAVSVGGDLFESLEVVLYWLGSSVAVAFIGFAVTEPERVERTMIDIMTRTVTAVAAVLS